MPAGDATAYSGWRVRQRMAWWWRYWELFYAGAPDIYRPDISTRWQQARRRQPGDESSPIEITALTVDSFLWRHNREEDTDYDNRTLRTPYRNFVRPVVDTYAAHIYSQPIRRNAGGAAEVAALIDDANRRGDSLTEWMRHGLALAQVFGHAYAVVDMPPRLAPSRSLVEDREQDVRPYATWFTPLAVANWEADGQGRFTFLTVREQHAGQPADRTWTREGWTLRRAGREITAASTGDVIAEGMHALGRVPVEVLYADRLAGEALPIGQTRVGDIVELARSVFNLDSLEIEMLLDQTFAHLVIHDPGGTVSRADISLHRALRTSGDGRADYIGPPVAYVEAIREAANDRVAQIRAMAGLARGASEESASARSGVALLHETHDKRAMLRALASRAEDFERRLVELVMRWVGRDATGVTIRYPDDYNVRPLEDQLDRALKFREIGAAPSAWREVVAQLTRAMLAHMEESELAAIVASAPEASDAAAAQPFYQYELEGGVVTLNEIRASKGLPPIPDGELTMPQYRAKYAATFAQATLTQSAGSAERIVGTGGDGAPVA